MKNPTSVAGEIFDRADCATADPASPGRKPILETQVADAQPPSLPLTEEMNRVVDEVGNEIDELWMRAARKVLEKVEW